MPGKIYTLEKLNEFVEEKGIELIGEYNETVNSKTTITGKCITTSCEGNFKKGFSYLLKDGEAICNGCAMINKKNKTKNTKKNLGKISNVDKLFKIIKEENIELLNDYDLNILDDQSMIIGKCKTENCMNKFDKTIHNLIYKSVGFYCKECTSINKMKKQGKNIYNYETLKEFVDTHGLKLLEDYSNKKIKGTTLIRGICNSNGCNEIFEKGLQYIITKNCPYCEKCIRIKISNNRDCLSFTYDDLIKYCKENNVILLIDYSSIKVVNYTIINGICNTDNCNYHFDKEFRAIVKGSGPYCKDCTNKRQIIKCEQTNLKIYGETSAMKTENIKEKRVNTNLERFGETSAIKLVEFKQKQKQTRENNFGTLGENYYEILCKIIDEEGIILTKDYSNKNIDNDTIIEFKCLTINCENETGKRFHTLRYKHGGFYCESCTLKNKLCKMQNKCEERFGVKNPSQSEEIKNKKSNTILNNYACKSCGLFLVFNHLRNNNDKVDDLCDYCQPNKTNKLREKTKELQVVRKLKEDLPDYPFIHNKSVGNECTLLDRNENTNGHLYPDIRFDLPYFQLIVEVDEFKHRGSGYECDERRMYEIVKQLGYPCVFIRYNPDDKKSNYDILLQMVKEYLYKSELEEGRLSVDFNELTGLKVDYLFY